MFTQNFLSLDAGALAHALSSDGVFAVQDAVSPEIIAALVRDVEDNRTGFNRNGVTGAYYFRQFYMCHMLAVSRSFSQMVTHPKIFEISSRIVGPDYRLKALRYYETYGLHHMQWHTDNKTDRGFAQIPGIIFIVYISDVDDGEFQYVRGSHTWSGEKAYNDYADDFVAQNYGQDILSFKGRAGTLVVYDTYGIHRARPVPRGDFVRKSLFWQIDREISQAEPILLNPEYLPSPDAHTLRYLGFGLPTEYHRFPQTDIAAMPPERMAPGDADYLRGELTQDLRLALDWTQNELAETRAYIKNMPMRDAAKALARAMHRRLPESVRRKLRKNRER